VLVPGVGVLTYLVMVNVVKKPHVILEVRSEVSAPEVTLTVGTQERTLSRLPLEIDLSAYLERFSGAGFTSGLLPWRAKLMELIGQAPLSIGQAPVPEGREVTCEPIFGQYKIQAMTFRVRSSGHRIRVYAPEWGEAEDLHWTSTRRIYAVVVP